MEVPRAWLALLAGSLVVALLLVAYLAGRDSGRRATEAATTDSPTAVAIDSEAADDVGDDETWREEWPPPEDPPEDVPPPAGGLAAWPPAEGSFDTAPQPSDWPAGSGTPPAADPRAPAVAAYFSEIEALEQRAKYWSNPQELAMSLVGQGAQGDTSGMQQLLETQRDAQRQIEAMTVPSPCQEHHRRTVEVLGRALELLETLEGGMASGDLEGLLSLTGEARQLEADTRQVDALGTQLKRQFGLPGS